MPTPDRSHPRSSALRRLRRLVVIVVLGLLIVVLALGGLIGAIALRAHPQRSGELSIPGLTGDVVVRRDASGITWIEASSSHDLFVAQGFVHAQDRLWQMEVLRRIAAGRTAELFGASQIETDAFIRTLGWRQAAEADLEAAGQEVRDALDAYSTGVNAYIERYGGTGLGFAVAGALAGAGLGYEPEPWTPLDSVGFAKLQAWNLGGNMASEIWRVLADARLGDPARTDELFPPYRDGARPLIAAEEGATAGPTAAGASTASGAGGAPTASSRRGLDPATAAGLRAVADTAASLLDLAGIAGAPSLATDRGIGSNNWVVAPSNSASGGALLANDPHLGYSNPPIWYMNGLRCRPVGPDCPYEVAGVTFPGVPSVILGHNATIAWGVTNVGPDVQDLYRLETVDATSYRDLDGTVRAFGTRDEGICLDLACADVTTMTVRTTVHGPVISDVDDRLADAEAVYAVRWTATDAPEMLLDAFFAVSRAGDIDEFHEALRSYGTPSQNFVYAGPDGIAYQTPGRLPVRASADALGLRPATDESGAWTGTIPYDELPRLENPPSGLIVTANNAIVARDDPRYLGWEFDHGDRAQRILDRLRDAADSGGVSLDELASIQVDSHAYRTMAILPALDLPARRATLTDPAALGVIDAIEGWDGACGIESVGCAAYQALELRLLANLVGDELGELATEWIGGPDSWVFLEERLVEPDESAWWDDARTAEAESRETVIARSLVGAGADLAAANGGSGIPAWGEIHTIRFREQTLGRSGIGAIEALFDLGPYAAPGVSGAPENVYYDAGAATEAIVVAPDSAAADAARIDLGAAFDVTSGPSYRLAVDVRDWDGARIIIPTGQSGSFLDRHTGDLIGRFLGREWLPFPFSPEAVEGATTELLTLRP